MSPPPILKRLFGRFVREDRGNLAIVFGLLAVPAMAAAGASIDYGRMTSMHNRMQQTADTIALALARDVEANASDSAMRATADGLFTEMMDIAELDAWKVEYGYDQTTSVVTVRATATIDTAVLSLLQINSIDLAVTSTTTFGTDKVEIALVLDNTGSMGNSDKLNQLKIAARNMIASLRDSTAGALGKATISIVPFAVSVDVGTENAGAPWMTTASTFTRCTTDRYDRTTCRTYSWNGCIGDRPSPYTSVNTAPVSGVQNSLYPREFLSCNVTSLMPLTDDWAAATTRIDEMIASGNTNVPVGLMWGWNMLKPGAPLSNATNEPGKNVQRYLILLTDGENTQNTLGNSASTIDTITQSTCTAIKQSAITVFSIRVIDGDSTLIRNCATSPEYYYDVTDAKMLDGVFKKIMLNISKLRVSS